MCREQGLLPYMRSDLLALTSLLFYADGTQGQAAGNQGRQRFQERLEKVRRVPSPAPLTPLPEPGLGGGVCDCHGDSNSGPFPPPFPTDLKGAEASKARPGLRVGHFWTTAPALPALPPPCFFPDGHTRRSGLPPPILEESNITTTETVTQHCKSTTPQ